MRRLGALALVFLAACQRDPRIDRLEPPTAPGGEPFVLTIRGRSFGPEPVVTVDGRRLPVTRTADDEIAVNVPPQRRGARTITVTRGDRASAPVRLDIENSPPLLTVASPHLVKTGDTVEMPIATTDFDGDRVTVTVEGPGVTTPKGLRIPTSTAGLVAVRVTAKDGRAEAKAVVEVDVVDILPAPKLDAVRTSLVGNRRAEVEVPGSNLSARTVFELDGVKLDAQNISRTTARVIVPPRPRGRYALVARQEHAASAPVTVTVANSTPVVEPVTRTIAEDERVEIPVVAVDPDGDETTTLAIDLWPGAYFDAERERIVFTPDFVQGGKTYRGTMVARDQAATGTAAVTVTVRDTIDPPAPKVIGSTIEEDHTRLVLRQSTDIFLDPTERDFEARLVVPHNPTERLPLRVYLHGFGGRPYPGGRGDQFCVYPHDPDNSYWWGAKDARGALAPFTARRVLNLVEWVLKTQPQVDPDRVYLFGSSMGGAGAVTIGTRYARHFAFAEGTMGQMIPRRHRPLRLEQLTELWGAPSRAWDDIDVVRLLVQSPEAAQQFLLTRHAKDDPVIHFGAVLLKSPVVDLAYYDALQRMRIGHYAVWDEGAHGPPDPELGEKWWVDDWDPALDPTTYLRRDHAFVAFSASTLDDDPGRAEGDGTRPFDADQGFAGKLEVVGDQGWGGDRSGALNRHLRWDTGSIVDEIDRFSVRVRSAQPARVRMTPRRTRRFVLRPGDEVRWRSAAKEAVVHADEHGLVTAEVDVDDQWQTIDFERRH